MKGNKLAFIVLIIVSVLTYLGYMFVDLARKDIAQEQLQYLTEVSNKNSMLMRSKIDSLNRQLKTVETFIEAQNFNETEKILQWMSLLIEDSDFIRMGIAYPDGTSYTTDGHIANFKDRDYFKKSLQGQYSISETLSDHLGDTEINVISVPIYEGKNIVGVLFGTMETSLFKEMMMSHSFNNQGVSFVVNEQGNLQITPSDEDSLVINNNLFNYLSEVSSNESALNQMKSDFALSKDGTVTVSYNGEKHKLSYTSVGINNWIMITDVLESVISSSSNNLITRITLIIMIGLIIVIVSGYTVINNYRRHSKEMQKIADTDSITGFNNYRKFNVVAKQLLKKNPHKNFVLIAFDVNKFKMINDLFGYKKGSETLQDICKVLSKHTSNLETFARASSDNFVMLAEYETKEKLLKRLEKIHNEVSKLIDNYKIDLRFGIYVLNKEKQDIDAIHSLAIMAASSAKIEEREYNYCFFDEAMRDKNRLESEYENHMRKALIDNEFKLVIQPKVEIKTGKVIGGEVLVRWFYHKEKLLYPDEFISLFEKNGFMKQLDYLIFENSIRLLSKWKLEHSVCSDLELSVNLSRKTVIADDVADRLLKIVNKYNIQPNEVELEITETAILEDTNSLIKKVNDLKSAGFKVSIDDFGNGYSSLHALKDLNVDVIKMDKSFLEDTNNKNSIVILSNLIQMCKKLDKVVLAEGVETEGQLRILELMECDIAQGFLFARGLDIEQFEEYVKEKQT